MADHQICPPAEKASLELANQGVVIEYLAHLISRGKKTLDESVILEIHRLTIDGIYDCAGHYRTAIHDVKIHASEHAPPPAFMVRGLVIDLLHWLRNGDGTSANSIKRAAYTIWKTNYIHPFNGGNGRVARALGYFVIAAEIAAVFDGPTSFVQIMKYRKDEYLAALHSGDRADLRPMSKLVASCLKEQLQRFFDEAIDRIDS